MDSRRWIRFLLDLLPKLDNTDFADLPPVEQRMLQMFYVTVWGKAAEDWNREDVLDDLYALSDSPILLGELQTLLQYQYDRIDFIDEPVDVGFDCPLDLHCTYTRDQLLVALDFLKPSTVREGVKWLPEKQLDVFFVTLNKADKDYSPTTMYNDYSITRTCSTGRAKAPQLKILPLVSDTSITGRKEAVCCCLSGSSKRIPVSAVPPLTPILAP